MSPPVTCMPWKSGGEVKTEPYADEESVSPPGRLCAYSVIWPATKTEPMTNVMTNHVRRLLELATLGGDAPAAGR